jgi:predicted methyltransferase
VNHTSQGRTIARAGLAILLTIAAGSSAAPVDEAALRLLAEGTHRAAGHAARNVYRHPVETLTFFGLEPNMTVVEIAPGGAGWYTEIIAPYLKASGTYYAASYDPLSPVDYYRRNARTLQDKLAERLDLYGHTILTVFAPPAKTDIAPPGSADLVVSFRNVHNWMEDSAADAAFAAFHRALKPGGVLGIVEHRGDPNRPQDPQAASGYVREDVVIAMAERAGFKLDARSEINANPKDDRDHPEGVWTLPPNLALGDKDRAKYAAIGESDRMTLRFRKP